MRYIFASGFATVDELADYYCLWPYATIVVIWDKFIPVHAMQPLIRYTKR